MATPSPEQPEVAHIAILLIMDMGLALADVTESIEAGEPITESILESLKIDHHSVGQMFIRTIPRSGGFSLDFVLEEKGMPQNGNVYFWTDDIVEGIWDVISHYQMDTRTLMWIDITVPDTMPEVALNFRRRISEEDEGISLTMFGKSLVVSVGGEVLNEKYVITEAMKEAFRDIPEKWIR